MALTTVPAGVTRWTKEATRRIVRDCQDEGHPVHHVWGYNASPNSDHRNRKCVDLMITSKEDGDWIFSYLQRYQRQLKVKYMIWYGQQWRDYPKPGIPAHQLARYAGYNQHHDHVHCEFWK